MAGVFHYFVALHGKEIVVVLPAASVALAVPVPLPVLKSPTFAVKEPVPLKALPWTLPVTVAAASVVRTTWSAVGCLLST